MSAKKPEKITAKRIKQDLRRAFDFKKNWIKEAQDDFMFALGKMWEDKDKEELRQKGVLALTINKIKPNIKLLTGIESQNRSDILCYPEGKESGIIAEIATGLVKNVWKTSGLNYKRSEQFKYGIICGESFLEPWIDYTQDMINGDMRWKRDAHNTVFFEPGFEEYDGSDASYAVKVTFGLRRDQILSLFPDKEDYLDDVATVNGSILGFEGMGELKDELGLSIQKHNYNDSTTGSSAGSPGDNNLIQEPRYDLVEYYFKKYVKKFYVIKFMYDQQTKKANDAQIKEVETEAEANQIMEAANMGAPEGQPAIKKLVRYVAEIWRASMIGEADELIEEEAMAPTYPRWPSFPFIPFYADRFVLPMKDANTHLLVQGIVRDMKSLNVEYNKRRTQELRILNSSANSGFVAEENSLVEESKWEKYGASPGVLLKVKQGKMNAWQKIEPSQLSQGHAQLAAEGSQDMKESSGINAEQLALETGDKSGRAIALKQKQGLVMVQNYFDNLSQTSRLLGKFILSHLGEVFDVPEAIHVMGDQFITGSFSEPVLEQRMDNTTGQMAQMPKMDSTGKMVMQVNKQRVVEVFQKVLDDATLGKFEVAVGETISNETMKYANYMVLMDMAKQGLPIPPDVIIDESMLSVSSKEKIKSFIEQQMAAQAQSQPAPQKGGK